MDMESPNSETKYEIDFFFYKLIIEKNVSILNKWKSNDHRIFRCKETLDRRREKEKLLKTKRPNTQIVREKSDEYRIRIHSKYSQRVDEINENSLNDK